MAVDTRELEEQLRRNTSAQNDTTNMLSMVQESLEVLTRTLCELMEMRAQDVINTAWAGLHE